MSREMVRQMKRAVRAHGRQESADTGDSAKACAIALLARSVSFGHGRLAVIRLTTAVRLGGDVPADHWDYCERVVAKCQDATLKELFDTASHLRGEASEGHDGRILP